MFRLFTGLIWKIDWKWLDSDSSEWMETIKFYWIIKSFGVFHIFFSHNDFYIEWANLYLLFCWSLASMNQMLAQKTEIVHNMMKYVKTFSKQTWKHLFGGDFRFELLSLNLTALSFRIGKRHLEFENVTCVSFFICLQNKILIRFSVWNFGQKHTKSMHFQQKSIRHI